MSTPARWEPIREWQQRKQTRTRRVRHAADRVTAMIWHFWLNWSGTSRSLRPSFRNPPAPRRRSPGGGCPSPTLVRCALVGEGLLAKAAARASFRIWNADFGGRARVEYSAPMLRCEVLSVLPWAFSIGNPGDWSTTHPGDWIPITHPGKVRGVGRVPLSRSMGWATGPLTVNHLRWVRPAPALSARVTPALLLASDSRREFTTCQKASRTSSFCGGTISG